MTKTGWAIRFYDPSDYFTNVGEIASNYSNFADRQEDDVIVFEGMYGLDSFLIWYIHKNIGSYDFTVDLEAKLFIDGNSRLPYYTNQYKVVNVKYDAKESRYALYAISIDSAKLQTKLIDYEIKSLMWKENRMPEDVLKDVLESYGIFKVRYMSVEYETSLLNIQYRSLSINEDWTIADFINYICQENNFEWFVRKGILYVGKELNAILELNSTKKFDIQNDNVAESILFRNYFGSTLPMSILSHINKQWRCVWVKHIAGRSGGLSKGCFSRIGIGSMDKELYFRTLDGPIEKSLATKLLNNNTISHYITIGSILQDEGEAGYVDNISVQKNIENIKVVNPNDTLIDKGEDSAIPVVNQKEKVCRTTPYLDDGAGMLFPRNKQDKIPPNSLLFNVEGREHASVVGPFVMGNSDEEMVIPFKNPDDFRLHFQNGWCLYVTSDGKTILQPSNTDPETEPTEDNAEMQIILDPATGLMKINKDSNSYIEINEDGKILINCDSSQQVSITGGALSASLIGHTHQMSNHTHPVSPGPLIPGPPITTSPPTNNNTVGESDLHSKYLKCVQE